MIQFARILPLGLAICCGTWLGVLWWWQRSGRPVAPIDVALYLGLLPLVAIVLVFALRHAIKAAGTSGADQGVAPAVDPNGSAAPNVATSEDEQIRHAALHLVYTACLCTGGAQAEELLQAAADGKPLPSPDPMLVNEAGLPIMSARLPDDVLGDGSCRGRLDELAEKLSRGDEKWQGGQAGEAVMRALAALHDPLVEQRQWLLDQPMGTLDVEARRGSELSRVRLLVGCAPQWSEFEQMLALRWVESLWAGDDNAIAVSYTVQILVVPGTAEELWLKVDQSVHSAQRGLAPEWLLVAAAHSDLDQQRIDTLAVAGRLYEPQSRPAGCMPGEAAAALLVAPPGWQPPPELRPRSMLLHRPALLLRNKQVEAGGRTDSQVLRDAVGHSLVAARLTASDVAAVVSDADQHSPRAPELYGATIDDFPHLDPLDDMRVFGKVTGNTGVASLLLVVACAAEWALKVQKPVLALSMADSWARLALIVRPDISDVALAHESGRANRTS